MARGVLRRLTGGAEEGEEGRGGGGGGCICQTGKSI
jgi:hypothetical protein